MGRVITTPSPPSMSTPLARRWLAMRSNELASNSFAAIRSMISPIGAGLPSCCEMPPKWHSELERWPSWISALSRDGSLAATAASQLS